MRTTVRVVGHVLTLLLLVSTFPHSLALSSTPPSSSRSPLRVVVSGAGGQTGGALFRQLLALPDEFDPVGWVRTEESRTKLLESLPPSSTSSQARVVVVDVTNTHEVQQNLDETTRALCICTSATPRPTGEVDASTGRPVFGYPPNGEPEKVDWIGQTNQIDACGPDTHVVLCSSMGGTDPDNMLNTLGRTTVVQPDGTTTHTGGNILKWKRKAELYLMNQSTGRPYTIVHPGGLLNEPGGQRELVVGVDDSQEGTESRTVPREDVAEVMLNALRHQDVYLNRSFDLRAKPPPVMETAAGDNGDDGGSASMSSSSSITTDFRALIESLGGKNCDYSLGETA